MPVHASPLSEAQWVEDVTARLLALDEGLGDEDVRGFVTDLAARPDWRALSPEAAASRAHHDLDPPEPA